MYTVITWPDIQEYMEIEGFRENSYLINDEKGINEFGSSAYFVDIDWLEGLNKQDFSMTEDRYQYLNSLSIEDYDKETNVAEQEAFCDYQHKYHPEDVMYYQSFSND